MFKIILFACFMNDPNACAEITLTGSGGDVRIPYTCLRAGPMAFQEWQNNHGKHQWIVRNFRCEEMETPVRNYLTKDR